MTECRSGDFQEALEMVESLPEELQEELIDTVRRRIIEQRRELLAQSVREARAEYQKGEVKRGTTDDLMRELGE
jgi:hypothetical protein